VFLGGSDAARAAIPLRCGPEIAVPATKSFMNQMVVFYCLALHVAERGPRRRQRPHARA